MKHLKYLNYVFKHRWFVFLECCKVHLYCRGIAHDLSKFLPDEFFPYADYFYGTKNDRRDESGYHSVRYSPEDRAFNFAWLLHQRRNRHHWQFWVLIRDNDDDLGEEYVFDIPLLYRKEMLADWRGAGKAQGYRDNTKTWWLKNGCKMKLHPNTRKWLDDQILEKRG